jgi:hypothetical protein
MTANKQTKNISGSLDFGNDVTLLTPEIKIKK